MRRRIKITFLDNDCCVLQNDIIELSDMYDGIMEYLKIHKETVKLCTGVTFMPFNEDDNAG